MKIKNDKAYFFDDNFSISEQLPRKFSISFNELEDKKTVRVVLNDSVQVGDAIDDNSYQNDYYRYHDIFHYTFATMLGWSPCARAMIKCKRKSNSQIDKIEDGARATITEEALSMIVFNEARKKQFFENRKSISKTTLRMIKEMTEPFEVSTRTEKDWQSAILKGYQMFRLLIANNGGKIYFNATNQEINFMRLH
jgi:MazG C-terminal domain